MLKQAIYEVAVLSDDKSERVVDISFSYKDDLLRMEVRADGECFTEGAAEQLNSGKPDSHGLWSGLQTL